MSERVNILLVDDEPANLLALEAVLGELGENLVTARSGEEALARLLEGEYAAILLDVKMPGLDGFETAELVRNRAANRLTPIIFLTGFDAVSSQLRQAYALGAVDYLTKPFVPEALRGKVTVFVELFRQSADLKLAERKAAEAALREQQEWWRITLASIGDAVIATDVADRVRFMNGTAERLTGWTEADAAGRPLPEVFRLKRSQSGNPISELGRAGIEEGRVVALPPDAVLVSKEGVEVPVADTAAPIADGSGKALGSVIVFRDTAERRRAEEELRESEHRFRTLFESMDEGYCIIEVLFDERDNPLDYRFLEVNPAFEKQTGIKDAKGRLMREIAPDHEQHWFDIYGRIARTGETLRFENPAAALGRHYDVCAFRVGPPELRRVGIVFNDITERKRTADALRQSEERLRTVTDAAKVGLVIVDPSHRYLFANRAYADVLGLPREDIVGRRVADVLGPVYEGQVRPRLDRAFAGERVTYELVVPPRDGASGGRVAAVAYEPQTNGGGVRSVVVAVVDITERKRAEEALREQARRKDEFIAMLAHELRNPLGPIRNAAQLVSLARDEVTLRRAQEMITRQVEHLAHIVNDLLEVSRLTRGKVELRRERLDLGQVVRLVAADAARTFETAGVSLTLDLPETPVWVEGDRTRLTQVVDNILSNAAKFTDRGGRTAVTLETRDHEAVLTVRDTGIGVEPALLPRLFEPFTQADTTLERIWGGLGLGLATVKGLVELHGGAVRAASGGPGKGTEFTVTLHRTHEPPALTGSPRRGTVAPKRRLKVLVVEDNRDAADSLRMLLELTGCEAAVAYTGPDGIAAARAFQPDLVLCDIGLPGLNGYEVARHLRTEFGGGQPLLVALTGYGEEEDRRRALEAGFDRHFTKPVDPAVIENLLVAGV